MRLRVDTFVTICVVIAGIVSFSETRSVHAVDAELEDQYVEVINAFLLNRQKLKTGITRFHTKYEYEIASVALDGAKRFIDIKGLYAFDFPEKLLRVDAEFQTTEADGSPVANSAKGYQFARLAKTTLLKFPDEPTPRRVINPDRELPEFVSRFDVRVLGATHAVGWDRMTLSQLAENYDVQGKDVTQIVREDKLVRVTWIVNGDGRPGFRRTIWFRVDRDYCPEKVEVCLPKYHAGKLVLENNQPVWNKPSQSQQLEVMELEGVWVPKNLTIIDGGTKREMEFSWTSLNKPLDADVFEFDHDPKE